MLYGISITALGDSFSIVGTIDSLAINSRLHTKAVSNDSLKPGEFHGVLSKHGVLSLPAHQQFVSCSQMTNTMTARIYELIISLPIGKRGIGDTWSDTVSSISCHGRTPITQQTVRQFTIKMFTTWHAHSVVKIDRLSNIIFTGASTGANTHLSAKGSGSGEATLVIDRTTSILLESNSHAKSTLTITTSRGEFPFTQLTSTYIGAKPDL
jgi:hypothetical protein